MNTSVNDGQKNSAATVEDCQRACVTDVQCTGVDYIYVNPAGQRCWLTGPWSGTRNNDTFAGVTHYDFNRNCRG